MSDRQTHCEELKPHNPLSIALLAVVIGIIIAALFAVVSS